MSFALWAEAKEQFVKEARSQNVEEKALAAFLSEQSSPSDAKKVAASIADDSGSKWTKIEVGGKNVSKWVGRIMDNIDRFVAIGDYAMKGAPETVGLAWFAVKQILNATQNNYKLYGFFGDVLNSITELLVLITTYDKLYDERAKVDFKASDVVKQLFSNIRGVYAAILDFGMAVSQHVKGSKFFAKVKHAVKDAFNASMPEFQAKKARIDALKAAILEGSQAAYQEKSLGSFDKMDDSLDTIGDSLEAIQHSIADIESGKAAMKEMLDEFKQMAIHKPSIEELARQEFEQTRGSLNALPNAASRRMTFKEHRRVGTCDWIFSEDGYLSWRRPGSSLLWISGDVGTGKSILLSAVYDKLQDESDDLSTLQCVICDVEDAVTPTVRTIQNTILAQVYDVFWDLDLDVTLLQQANAAFKNPKSARNTEKAKAGGSRDKRAANAFDFNDVLESLISLLKRRLILLVDGLDVLEKEDQTKLMSSLNDLLAIEGSVVQIMITSKQDRGSSAYFDNAPSHLEQINIEDHNYIDIRNVLGGELKNMPGWTVAEREEAQTAVLAKTGSNFKYLVEVALPYLHQAFPRPISGHLSNLPDSFRDEYDRAISRLSDNYRTLLRTALVWTLFSGGPVTVNEIMDAYTGKYNESEVNQSPDFKEAFKNEHEDAYETPKLYIEQLLDAGAGFVNIEGSTVKLKNFDAAWDYFVTADELQAVNGVSDGIREGICPTCHHNHGTSHRLHFTEKQGHMELALTVLRHAKSSAFMYRFMSQDDEDDTNSAGSENSDGESEGVDSGSETDPEGNLSRADQSGVSSEPNVDIEGESDELKAGRKEESIDQEGLPQLPADATGLDADGSLDSEDRIMNDDYTSGYSSSGVSETSSQRYEVLFLLHHARKVEELLTSAEKIVQPNSGLETPFQASLNRDWNLLQSEIYDFVTNSDRLRRWRQAKVSYPHELPPAFVGAIYGLTSFLERYLGEVDNRKETLHERVEGKYNVLDFALEGEDFLDTVQVLLQNGSDPNDLPDEATFSTFQYCFSLEPSFECVDLLLKYGASCSLEDTSFSSRAIHKFAQSGSDPRILTLLLHNPHDPENQSDINAKDKDDETPLHYLMGRASVPIDLLKAFIESGADVNAENISSLQPLGVAAQYGEIAALKLLIEKVKDVNDDNCWGRTALHGAAWGNKKGTVIELLSKGADISRVDKHQRTALFFACLGVDESQGAVNETAHYLIDTMIVQDIDISLINKPTLTRRTPLREAAAHSLNTIVQTILDKLNGNKEIINMYDTRKRRTALHCAALHGNTEGVQLLLKAGADTTLKDLNKQTALDICREQWAFNGTPNFAQSALHIIDAAPANAAADREIMSIAAMNGSVPVLKRLLDAGAPLNEPDEHGWTPGLIAKQYQQAEAAKFLAQRLSRSWMSPTKWASTTELVSMLEDGRIVTTPGTHPCCLTADHPLVAGSDTFYFEVEIEATEKEIYSPIFAIGFSTAVAKHLKLPGWKSKSAPAVRSWAYHCEDGGLFHSDERRGSGDTYGVGDTVGAGVDFRQKLIFFTKNGKRNDDCKFEGISGRLFPVIGFHRCNVSLITNFGNDAKKPFRWQS